MTTRYVKAAEIANQYGFSTRYWIRLAAEGKIPGVTQPSGHNGAWVFEIVTFHRWAKQNRYDRKNAPLKKRGPYRRDGNGTMVYAIYSAGHIKFGLSSNVQNRSGSFHTASPLPITLIATVPGGFALEVEIQQKFSAHRAKGEWFRLTDEVRTFVNQMSLDGSAINAIEDAEAEFQRWVAGNLPS